MADNEPVPQGNHHKAPILEKPDRRDPNGHSDAETKVIPVLRDRLHPDRDSEETQIDHDAQVTQEIPGLKKLREELNHQLQDAEEGHADRRSYVDGEAASLLENGVNEFSDLTEDVSQSDRPSRLSRLVHMVNIPGQIREARRNRAAREERDRLTNPDHIHPGEESERKITHQQAERIKDILQSRPNEQAIADAAQAYREDQKAEARANSRWRRVVRAGINRVAEYFVPETESSEAVEADPDGFVSGNLNDLDAIRKEGGYVSVYDTKRGDNSIAVRVNAPNYSVGGKEHTNFGTRFFSLIELEGSDNVWALSRPHIGKHHTNSPVQITKIDRETGAIIKRTAVTVNPDKSISIPFSTKDAPIVVSATNHDGIIDLHALGDTKIHVLASPGAIVEKEGAPQAA